MRLPRQKDVASRLLQLLSDMFKQHDFVVSYSMIGPAACKDPTMLVTIHPCHDFGLRQRMAPRNEGNLLIPGSQLG